MNQSKIVICSPICFILIIITVIIRFRGELFGLGNNHTKYKTSKYNGGSMSGSYTLSTPAMSIGNNGYQSSQALHYNVSSNSLSAATNGNLYHDHDQPITAGDGY
jgi:hypothetical protein